MSKARNPAPKTPKATPPKPYPEYPLYAHQSGQWAKKIRGRTVYFGPWGDPDYALRAYLDQRDYLLGGVEPPADDESLTLDELVNRFLAHQRQRCDIGEISQRHYLDYQADGRRILDALGRTRPVRLIRPADFGNLKATIAAGRNATTLTNMIVRIRAIFRWGHTARLLTAPVEFGGAFSLPPARSRRRALREGGRRVMEPHEIRTLLDASRNHCRLHAMILLGINAGFGNTDCACLPLANLHLDADPPHHDFYRPKTEIPRRAVLWPETVEALRQVLERRQRRAGRIPAELADLVFVTDRMERYVRLNDRNSPIDSIRMQFRRLAENAGLHRTGRGFYMLRHTFRTVADETKDFPAVDLVMGHAAADVPGAPHAVAMGDRYRERIGDDRLQAIADHVHAWLFERQA
jgi:site-specific recombinase XerD